MVQAKGVGITGDEPVIPASLTIGVDDVVSLGIAGVALHEILHRGVGIVDPDGLVERPHDHAVSTGGHYCVRDLCVQSVLERCAGDWLLPVW